MLLKKLSKPVKVNKEVNRPRLMHKFQIQKLMMNQMKKLKRVLVE